MLREFETVFFTDATLFRPTGFPGLPQSSRQSLRLPFALLKATLNQEKLKPLDAALLSGKIESVVVGAKNFHVVPRFDQSLPVGPLRSDSCFLLHLVSGAPDLKAILGVAEDGNLNGQLVWKIPINYGGEVDHGITMFVLQPVPEYILLATSETLVTRMTSSLKNGQAPALSSAPISSFPGKAYWGIRNYGLVSPPPPGALSLDTIMGVSPDSLAAYLMFTLGDSPDAEFHYVSAGRPSESFAMFRLQPSTPGEWKTSISFSAQDDSLEQLLRIFSVFGFGAVV